MQPLFRGERQEARIAELEAEVARQSEMLQKAERHETELGEEVVRLRGALENIPCRDCGNPVGWPPLEAAGNLVAALRCGKCAATRLARAALERHA